VGTLDLVGATAWAYDLTFDSFAPDERSEIERWFRTAARTMIEQENVLTTTPNLVFCQHWRIGMIGYCLGDKELIDYALRDPGRHGATRGGFYPVLDSMIRDGQFWGEAPIYALHYDVHGMFALAEAALRYDGTNLYEYVSPKSGASLKKIVDGYLRMGFPLEKNGAIRLATFGDGSTGCSISGELEDTYWVSDPLVGDYAVDRNATATLAFPIVSGRNVRNVTLESLTVEGNQGNAFASMDGCRGAGVYFYESERVTIRNCSVRDYRGDGISIQWKSKDVAVEDCLVEKNSGFGFHPGSDTNACVFRGNKSLSNGGPGLFVCVAVHHCRFEGNEIRGNGGEGISIGERDSDNVFVANEITANGRAGVLFRGDTEGGDLEPHRNVFEKNKILGNAAGIVVRGKPRDLVFRDNIQDQNGSQ